MNLEIKLTPQQVERLHHNFENVLQVAATKFERCAISAPTKQKGKTI